MASGQSCSGEGLRSAWALLCPATQLLPKPSLQFRAGEEMVLGTGGLRAGNRPDRPEGVGGCAANPEAGWAGRTGTGAHLPLETEEVQKGAGQGISASRNPLDPPPPPPQGGPQAPPRYLRRAGRRRRRLRPAVGAREPSCRASLESPPFMGVISAPV